MARKPVRSQCSADPTFVGAPRLLDRNAARPRDRQGGGTLSQATPSLPLSSLLTTDAELLRERWNAASQSSAQRLEQAAGDHAVYGALRRLLNSLIELIDQSRSADQVGSAVEQRLGPLLSNLRSLQDDSHLSLGEIVTLLSTLREAVFSAFGRTARESAPPGTPQGPIARPEDLHQISMLLGRLGVVFAESGLHSGEASMPQQEVLAIEYALLYERTRQLAITDALTGLYNFGYLYDRLKEERARAERYQRLLSFILFDIDFFKTYNDNHGHPAGNEILRRISRILSEECREVDIVARYGGEEMAVLSPEINRRRAHMLAERIRERIAETLLPYRDSQPLGRITVSAGVATYPLDADSEDNLIRCADRALYAAKGSGRNCVIAYQPEHKVTITFRPPYPVQSVALVGNFNAWDPGDDICSPTSEGTVQFTIALNPGTYRYKFVLDGHQWVADPEQEQQPDSFGGENNVLRVRR